MIYYNSRQFQKRLRISIPCILRKNTRKSYACNTFTSRGSFSFIFFLVSFFFRTINKLACVGAREPGSRIFALNTKASRYSWSIYRAATAALVEKQSSEMLELINEARSEYMLQESLYLDEGDGYTQEAPPPPYPSRAPPPQPPALAKYHIYNDPLEFADMDQIAISVRLHRGILSALVSSHESSSLSLEQDFTIYNLSQVF